MIKRISIIVFTICIAVSNIYGYEYFEIDNYYVEMKIGESNQFFVNEKIDVNFLAERHGLKIKIPYGVDSYNNLTNIQVENREYKITYKDNEVEARIGSADKYVYGKQEYLIRYDYEVCIDKYNGNNYLKYDLIAPQWDTKILSADFLIEMPSNFDENKMKINNSSGRANSNIVWSIEGKTMHANLIEKLYPYEGVSINLRLEDDFWIIDIYISNDYEENTWNRLKLLKSQYNEKRVRVKGEYFGINDYGEIVAIETSLKHEFNEDIVEDILSMKEHNKYEFYGIFKVNSLGKPYIFIEKIVE